jgi:hypothetical protein
MPRFRPFEPPRPESEKCPTSGKRIFADEREARAEAGRIANEGGANLDVYMCMHCRGWHFTSL